MSTWFKSTLWDKNSWKSPTSSVVMKILSTSTGAEILLKLFHVNCCECFSFACVVWKARVLYVLSANKTHFSSGSYNCATERHHQWQPNNQNLLRCFIAFTYPIPYATLFCCIFVMSCASLDLRIHYTHQKLRVSVYYIFYCKLELYNA